MQGPPCECSVVILFCFAWWIRSVICYRRSYDRNLIYSSETAQKLFSLFSVLLMCATPKDRERHIVSTVQYCTVLYEGFNIL